MTIYVYKYERSVFFFNNVLMERSKRRWRVTSGDTILFTQGAGEELRFVGTADVISVERMEEDEEHATFHVTKVTYDEMIPLPSDRTLRAFMFSLVRISNFGRPQLNVRHLSRFVEEDLETIRTGNINFSRSLYYGLLRYLPPRWRAFFEHESQARGAFKGSWAQDDRLPSDELPSDELVSDELPSDELPSDELVSDELPSDELPSDELPSDELPSDELVSDELVSDELPSDELVRLFQEMVVSPLKMAAEIQPIVRAVVQRLGEPESLIEAVFPDSENAAAWNITSLLSRSGEQITRIESLFDVIIESMKSSESRDGYGRRRRNRQWRPHKW